MIRDSKTRTVETPALASHVADTVETIAALHARTQHEVGPHVRRISRLSASIGRPAFLLAVVGLVAAWIASNLVAPLAGLVPADPPPFAWLQGAVSLSSLLMTTVVLVTQDRVARHVEQRARLDLQINLLAEQKIAKLIGLVEELRRDMPNVRDRIDAVANEMKQPVDTNAVLVALERTIESKPRESPTPLASKASRPSG